MVDGGLVPSQTYNGLVECADDTVVIVETFLKKKLNASKPSKHVKKFRWEHWL